MRTLVVNALRMSEQRTGQGRHIEFIAQQWSRMSLPFDRVVLMSPGALQLDGLGSTTEIELNTFEGQSGPALWEQVHLPRQARGAAMLFCPSYTCPLLHRGPIVLAVHGIYEAIPAEFPRLARIRATTINRLSCQRADRVIANSRATKDDLTRFFHVDPGKMDTIYPAAHDFYFEHHASADIEAEVVRAFGHTTPYVIFVGKLAKRRHIPNLIEAFAIARKRAGLPHHLLIVGPNTSGIPLAELAQAHGLQDVVVHQPYVDLVPLARLYQGADLYALPTIYEGISQTMFEAMASGTAVLTVDHPTLVEGGADAVLSMPTPSVEDLADGLTRLLTDGDLRKSYAMRGRARAQRFSWGTVARDTLSILDRVARAADR